MNNYTNPMNAALFVKWHYWEKFRWEWQVADEHFSFEEVAKFLHEKEYLFPQSEWERIWFDIPRYIKKDDYWKSQFHEEIIYENDLRKWYIHHTKADADLLNGDIIWLTLEIPYSNTQSSFIDVPVAFSQFCGLIWKQYHQPELVIEDIPF